MNCFSKIAEGVLETQPICGRLAAKVSLTLPDFDYRYCSCTNIMSEIDSDYDS